MTQIGNYNLQEELGSGSFGVVYRAELINADPRFPDLKSGSSVAFKLVPKGKKGTAESEIEASEKIPIHIGLMRMYEHFPYGKHECIITEFLGGGDLANRRPMSEEEIKGIMRYIMPALISLHSRGFYHRDIKPDNLMYKYPGGTVAKVIDFGLFYDSVGGKRTPSSFGGTPRYFSPELALFYEKKVFKKKLNDYDESLAVGGSEKCDVWALGITIMELLIGSTPYAIGGHDKANNLNFTRIYQKLFKVGIDELHISDLGKLVLHKMLEIDPSKRWSMSRAYNEWFQIPGLRRSATSTQYPTQTQTLRSSNLKHKPAIQNFQKPRDIPITRELPKAVPQIEKVRRPRLSIRDNHANPNNFDDMNEAFKNVVIVNSDPDPRDYRPHRRRTSSSVGASRANRPPEYRMQEGPFYRHVGAPVPYNAVAPNERRSMAHKSRASGATSGSKMKAIKLPFLGKVNVMTGPTDTVRLKAALRNKR